PGVCACLRLRYFPADSWEMQRNADDYARPCPEAAPGVVYACCQDGNSKEKWQAFRERERAGTETDAEQERQAEEKRRQAEAEIQRREGVTTKLIASILDKWTLDQLWQDTRFLKFAAERVRYEFRACIDAGESLADIQANILRAAIVTKSHEGGIGYAIDLAETSKNRQRLFRVLADPGKPFEHETNEEETDR
ncbi:MAG: hypothetical protein WBO46_04035, partial [Caldilineaceae bacterium]